MLTPIKFFIAAFFIFSSLICLSQNDTKLSRAIDMKMDPSLQSQAERIISEVQYVFDDFAKASTIFNEQANEVNGISVTKFENFFRGDYTAVLKDYVEVPQVRINYEQYAKDIRRYLGLKGLRCYYNSAQIIEISKNSDGYYYDVYVKVNKVIYNYYDDKKRKEVELINGTTIEQIIRFDMETDFSSVKVVEIDFANTIELADNYTHIFNGYLGAGVASYNPKMSSYWDENKSDANFELKSGVNISTGVEFFTNKWISNNGASKRPLYISLGFGYSLDAFELILDSYSLSSYNEIVTKFDDETELKRDISNIQLKEDLNFHSLTIPMGLGVNIKDADQFLFIIHGRIIPSIVFGVSGNYEGNLFSDARKVEDSGEVSNNYFYNSENPGVFSNNGIGYYGLGIKDFNGDSNLELNSLGMALQISPTTYFNFANNDPGWGLLVGLDFGYRFNSYVNHNNNVSVEDEKAVFNGIENTVDFNGSAFNNYVHGMNAFTFGIRIGVFYRDSSKL